MRKGQYDKNDVLVAVIFAQVLQYYHMRRLFVISTSIVTWQTHHHGIILKNISAKMLCE